MTNATHSALLAYYTDASTWNCAELLTPSGDEFWRTTSCDLAEFPELSTVFGVQLTPDGRLVLHASQLEYMAAVAAACV